ncbi:uncharacterized protein [Anas acuta]|uniref:uncharacterized protein n=1 Tax=Anas acuta TaxID=28680 RepID=UPI0035C8C97B
MAAALHWDSCEAAWLREVAEALGALGWACPDLGVAYSKPWLREKNETGSPSNLWRRSRSPHRDILLATAFLTAQSGPTSCCKLTAQPLLRNTGCSHSSAQHLQQRSAPPPPHLPSREARLCLLAVLWPQAPPAFINPACFQGPRTEMLRRKLQAHPQITELERIPGRKILNAVYRHLIKQVTTGLGVDLQGSLQPSSEVARRTVRVCPVDLCQFRVQFLCLSDMSSRNMA